MFTFLTVVWFVEKAAESFKSISHLILKSKQFSLICLNLGKCFLMDKYIHLHNKFYFLKTNFVNTAGPQGREPKESLIGLTTFGSKNKSRS